MARTRRRRSGFTLVELMLVVAIIGLLAAISVNEFEGLVMHAKRTEAIVGLSQLWTAQKDFLAEHDRYASSFTELSTFAVEGGTLVSPTTYKGTRYTYQLSQPWGPEGFYCIATGQLDPDEWPDIIEIYELPGSPGEPGD